MKHYFSLISYYQPIWLYLEYTLLVLMKLCCYLTYAVFFPSHYFFGAFSIKILLSSGFCTNKLNT